MTYRSDDLLTEVLSSYRLSARVFAHASYCGHWEINTAGRHKATFHLIGRGTCWLQRHEGETVIPLQAGDLVVFPHDAWHLLTACPRPTETIGYPQSDQGPATTVMCGYFDFGEQGRNPILESLPEVIIVRAEQTARYAKLEQLARLILMEADSEQIGSQLVLDTLAAALFVMILRFQLENSTDRHGLLAALADPQLAKALAAAHRAPGNAWTVEALAAVAGLSRTTFAIRFTELVGESPMQYLNAVRMRRANELLQNPRCSVAMIAEAVGYHTEAAFRRAYKRHYGIGPGAARRAHSLDSFSSESA
ncbi:MAG: AraC family transcriptional regulator [Candidatus Competibacteraceae bacterium]|jgi:AraC-like DNA-binding protein|nr:AraC family transcriptional regulator [Candidatus Competibacteraceae bacterium]